MIGSILGHYRVIRSLGQGGMGEIYLAEDLTLKRQVAIKTLSSGPTAVPRSSTRLRMEAEALAAVNHPNVVTVHSVEEEEGILFIVMELVEGRTVAELLPPKGFPLERIVKLAIPIATALQAAHERGVVHRDLKPGNVMVTTEGQVKVVDFGLAKIFQPGGITPLVESATTMGFMVGTVPYMAPEQFGGEQVDARTDLYALGVVLFEMATGSRPFIGTTPAELIGKILLQPPPSARSLQPALPDRLDHLITSLLAKDAAARPGSARAVATELEAGSGQKIIPVAQARVESPRVPQPTRSVDPRVVELVVRGRRLWNSRTEENLRTGFACFQEAIDIDPLHAPAWIGLADSLNMLGNYGFAPPDECNLRVRAAAEKAIELGGESADALRALALMTWQFEFDWDAAGQLYRLALEKDPDSSLTHYWYSAYLGVTRRFDDCLRECKRAEELDPLSLIVPAGRGWFTLFAGRAEEGLAQLRRVLSLDARLHPALWFQGQALAALGRYDEAAESLSKSIVLGGPTSRLQGYLGYALGRGGRTAEARELLGELRERGRERYVPPYFSALILMGLGDRGQVLDQLEATWAARDSMIRDVGVDPTWWDLHSEPRYHDLLTSMGLPLLVQ